MKCAKNTLLLYAVTDRAWANKQTLYQQVECALKGGATCVQLREKELNEADFLTEALAIKKLCQTYGIPFIVNDNIDIALACGADGIHVGQHDTAAANVRRRIGEKMLLGVSVQTVSQAVAAEKNGADYLGVGAVFGTTTKPEADIIPYSILKAICQAVNIPVVAIGGIYKHNILQLQGSGIDGVALVSAIFAAEDIEQECKELRALTAAMIS